MKRSCCLKSSPAARRGIELSRLTIIKAIAVPLVLVAVDVATDGNMLYFMSTEGGFFDSLFVASCFILGFSLLNLLLENPIKTLIRNARTSVLMQSREMESKDVPVPIGDYIYCEVMLAKNHSFAQIISHEMTWGSMKAWGSHRTSSAYNGSSTSA